MNNFVYYVYECPDDELKEFINTAKTVARILHHKITIFTATQTIEVCENEEDKEKEKEVEDLQEKS